MSTNRRIACFSGISQGFTSSCQTSIAKIHAIVREQVIDYYSQMSITLHAPPSQYVLRIILNDKIAGKSGSFDLPFEIK